MTLTAHGRVLETRCQSCGWRSYLLQHPETKEFICLRCSDMFYDAELIFIHNRAKALTLAHERFQARLGNPLAALLDKDFVN